LDVKSFLSLNEFWLMALARVSDGSGALFLFNCHGFKPVAIEKKKAGTDSVTHSLAFLDETMGHAQMVILFKTYCYLVDFHLFQNFFDCLYNYHI
jgi:hypothetical protein